MSYASDLRYTWPGGRPNAVETAEVTAERQPLGPPAKGYSHGHAAGARSRGSHRPEQSSADLCPSEASATTDVTLHRLDFKDNRPKDIADLFHDPCKKTIEDSTVAWSQRCPWCKTPSREAAGTSGVSEAKNRIVEHFQELPWASPGENIPKENIYRRCGDVVEIKPWFNTT
eukprot:Skav202810  [mRNA]  locus=scaffold326:1023596:1028761:+ [translate_table: standard]